MSRMFDGVLALCCSWCLAIAAMALILPPTEAEATGGGCEATSGCSTGCCSWGVGDGGRYACWCNYCCIA